MNSVLNLSWYRFGYRGIYFNLLLAGLIVLANGLLFAPASAAYHFQERSLLLAVVLVAAFVAEPFFFYRRLRDVSAERFVRGLPKLGKNRGGMIFFILLLFNAVVGGMALSLAGMALGYDGKNVDGIAGMLALLRFLVMFGSSIFAVDATQPLSGPRILWTDIGVGAYSAVLYVCVWRVVVMPSLGNGEFTSLASTVTQTLDLLLVAMIWFLPMRFVFFLEEWWARPGRSALVGIVATLFVLVGGELLIQYYSFVSSVE